MPILGENYDLQLGELLEGAILHEARERVADCVRGGHVEEPGLLADVLLVVAARPAPLWFERDEVGAGWVQYWLGRMDAVYDSVMGRGLPLKEKPSFYFKRNVWVSADPDEKSLPAMVDLCGDDRFMWASDFPHPDHTGDYIEELEEMVEKMPEAKRRNVLGDNVRRVYKLSA
jgi:amidohydrolase family protein